jgi:hypothetical protein
MAAARNQSPGTKLEGDGVETEREGATPCSRAETPGREAGAARAEGAQRTRKGSKAPRGEEAGRHRGSLMREHAVS